MYTHQNVWAATNLSFAQDPKTQKLLSRFSLVWRGVSKLLIRVTPVVSEWSEYQNDRTHTQQPLDNYSKSHCHVGWPWCWWPFMTTVISLFILNILLFLNLALLRHMANHKERFWDRWPMVMTFAQRRVKPRKTTRRLVCFLPIRPHWVRGGKSKMVMLNLVTIAFCMIFRNKPRLQCIEFISK